jgi:hypothetical protein
VVLVASAGSVVVAESGVLVVLADLAAWVAWAAATGRRRFPQTLVEAIGNTIRRIVAEHPIGIAQPLTSLAGQRAAIRWQSDRRMRDKRLTDKAAGWRVIALGPAVAAPAPGLAAGWEQLIEARAWAIAQLEERTASVAATCQGAVVGAVMRLEVAHEDTTAPVLGRMAVAAPRAWGLVAAVVSEEAAAVDVVDDRSELEESR